MEQLAQGGKGTVLSSLAIMLVIGSYMHTNSRIKDIEERLDEITASIGEIVKLSDTQNKVRLEQMTNHMKRLTQEVASIKEKKGENDALVYKRVTRAGSTNKEINEDALKTEAVASDDDIRAMMQ